MTVNASATGGASSYKYAVLYKKTTDTKWTWAQNYSTNSTVTVTPKKVAVYEICVRVKDAAGTIAEETFTVQSVK